ncbi:MAG: glycosyltransferase family 2 protein [Planctomycetota bacterium]
MIQAPSQPIIPRDRNTIQEFAVEPSPIVSIVIPTFNRLDSLRACISRIRYNVSTRKELVVVDGGSTDGTRDWLSQQTDLRVILEERREGAVRAFNKGFRAATGRFVCWSNDDGYPLPGSVEAAIDMIERPDLSDVGMVAFYHNWHSPWNVLDRISHDGENFEMCHVRGFPYANFGLIRNELLMKIGYADERYYFFGFDPDLSLKVQVDEGLKVIGCRRALMRHQELHDERKLEDLTVGSADNEKLFAKWNLPAKGAYADPAPAYLELLRSRGLMYDGIEATPAS